MLFLDISKELLQIRPDIRIILCTDFNEMISEEKSRQVGINAFLMKPFSLQDLAVMVKQVLDNKSAI